MSLAERIADAAPVNTCKTCQFYDNLAPDDRAAFDAWVAEDRPSEALRRFCAEEGLQIGRTAFREHILDHHLKQHLKQHHPKR